MSFEQLDGHRGCVNACSCLWQKQKEHAHAHTHTVEVFDTWGQRLSGKPTLRWSNQVIQVLPLDLSRSKALEVETRQLTVTVEWLEEKIFLYFREFTSQHTKTHMDLPNVNEFMFFTWTSWRPVFLPTDCFIIVLMYIIYGFIMEITGLMRFLIYFAW